MSPKTHASVMDAFNKITLVASISAFLVICFTISGNKTLPFLAFFALAIAVALAWLVIELQLVRCPTPNCQGVMVKSIARLSAIEARLSYRCSVCGSTYEADIFYLPPADPLQ